MGDNKNKIILDLCGGTGAWSRPYKEAGYDVRNITLPEYDVGNWQVGYGSNHVDILFKVMNRTDILEFQAITIKNVWGILAAPPCTMFSLARTTAKKPRDIDGALEVVRDCLDVIWKAKPTFWAMENPRGLLRKFMGKPAFTFDASEFGETYNKHTDLWGYFNEPKKKREYKRYKSTDKNTRKLPDIPKDYKIDTTMSRIAIKRSITPKGFSEAFYKANK
jgi:site-specific DNA-cytosine methylase